MIRVGIVTFNEVIFFQIVFVLTLVISKFTAHLHNGHPTEKGKVFISYTAWPCHVQIDIGFVKGFLFNLYVSL